jgi:hypothetical protein
MYMQSKPTRIKLTLFLIMRARLVEEAKHPFKNITHNLVKKQTL